MTACFLSVVLTSRWVGKVDISRDRKSYYSIYYKPNRSNAK